MSDELKSVRCGCGGEARIGKIYGDAWTVECTECGIQSGCYDTEAEAVEAWNRAMGAKDINVPDKSATDIIVGDKRTAKVTTIEKPIKGSDSTISVFSCSQCRGVVSIFDTYCPNCGARLEWK